LSGAAAEKFFVAIYRNLSQFTSVNPEPNRSARSLICSSFLLSAQAFLPFAPQIFKEQARERHTIRL
jgi:hypothetical protein